jgi:hypothetical protein
LEDSCLLRADVVEETEPDGGRSHRDWARYRGEHRDLFRRQHRAAATAALPTAATTRNIASEQRNQALDGRGTFSVPDFFDVQKSATTIEYVATFQRSGTMTTDGNEPERLIGAAVNADYFNVLGVKPELGRTFTRDEDTPGAAPVVLISHGLWQRRYGGDKNIIGREIDLGGKTTVVGVVDATRGRGAADK